MEMIRQKVYQLEQAQIKMKQEFVPSIPKLEGEWKQETHSWLLTHNLAFQ
jgi:hypothetical protein